MLFVLELYWGKDKKRKEKERKGKKRKEKKRKEKGKKRKGKKRKGKKRKEKGKKRKGKKRKDQERKEKEWKGKKRKEKKRKEKERKEKERKGKKRIDPQPKLEKANDGSWKAIMKRKWIKEMKRSLMKRKWIKEMKRSLMKRKWIKEMKRSQILRIVLGGQLLISTLKLFWEGGGEGGGDPYTNQHPTLVCTSGIRFACLMIGNKFSANTFYFDSDSRICRYIT